MHYRNYNCTHIMSGKMHWKYFAGNIFMWLECEVYRGHSQYELGNLNLLVTLCSRFFVARFPSRFGRHESTVPSLIIPTKQY